MTGCPICTKYGFALFAAGFITLLLAPSDYFEWLGLGLIIAAYIVPRLIPAGSCKLPDGSPGGCANPVAPGNETKNNK
jgi:hypothetical protein